MTTSAPAPTSTAAAQAAAGAPECVFVTGVMRSGTTVLQRVVAHSLATDYLRRECSLRLSVEAFETLERHQAFAPLARADYVDHYQRLFSGLLAAMRARIGGATLVLKDPLAINTLACFHELMPRSAFVISVRNPLATAASIYRVRNRQRAQGKQSFITPMDFGDIVDFIARQCDIIAGLRAHANVCLVKYEDLIGRAPATLAQLGHFLGVPVRLDVPDDSAAYDPAHAFWTPEAGKDLAMSSLAKHENALSADETALVTQRLAHFNALFGYD